MDAFTKETNEKIKRLDRRILIAKGIEVFLYLVVATMYYRHPPEIGLAAVVAFFWFMVLVQRVLAIVTEKRLNRSLHCADVALRLMSTANDYALAAAKIQPSAFMERSFDMEHKQEQLQAAFKEYFEAKV